MVWIACLIALAAALAQGCNRPDDATGGADTSGVSGVAEEGKTVEIPGAGLPKELPDDLKMLVLDDPFGKGVGLRNTLEEALKKLLPGESPSGYKEEKKFDWEIRMECVNWTKAPVQGDPQNIFTVNGTRGASKNPVNAMLAMIDAPGAKVHGNFLFLGRISEKSTLAEVEEIFGVGMASSSPDGASQNIAYLVKVSPADSPGRTYSISVNFLVNKGGNVRYVQLTRK